MLRSLMASLPITKKQQHSLLKRFGTADVLLCNVIQDGSEQRHSKIFGKWTNLPGEIKKY